MKRKYNTQAIWQTDHKSDGGHYDNRINVMAYGALGVVGTDYTTELTDAKAAFDAIGEGAVLYFPKGNYLSVAGMTLETSADNQSFAGDGYGSILNKIAIQIKHSYIMVDKLHMKGTGTYGVVINDEQSPAVSTVISATLSNLYITERTYGIAQLDTSSYHTLNNCVLVSNDTNMHLLADRAISDDRGDMMVNNCLFNAATGDTTAGHGIHIEKFGTLMLNNCKIQTSAGYGLAALPTSNANDVVRQIFANNCSFEGGGSVKNRTYTITAFADSATSPGSKTTVTTSANHLLRNGMYQINIKDAIAPYNGTNLEISNVTDDTFDIEVTFTTNPATGTVYMFNWDVYLHSANTRGNMNDCVFTGGDINYLYIGDAFNISFVGTLIKHQRRIGTAEGANTGEILFVHTGYGRNEKTKAYVPVDPDNTRYGELTHEKLRLADAACEVRTGIGTPEGNVTADIGSIYMRGDGGAGTSMYVKESGTGDTGWAGK